MEEVKSVSIDGLIFYPSSFASLMGKVAMPVRRTEEEKIGRNIERK